MTGPVTKEALVEDLRASHLAAIDACLRASETTGEVPQGLRLREREAAAALISTLLAALQQVTAERGEARRMHRWNIDRTGDGEVLVCRGYHDKGEDCDHERFVPEERLATATSELARLRAEGEAKNRALKPFADEADRYDPPENDDDQPLWDVRGSALCLRDLRAARAATAREGA